MALCRRLILHTKYKDNTAKDDIEISTYILFKTLFVKKHFNKFFFSDEELWIGQYFFKWSIFTHITIFYEFRDCRRPMPSIGRVYGVLLRSFCNRNVVFYPYKLLIFLIQNRRPWVGILEAFREPRRSRNRSQIDKNHSEIMILAPKSASGFWSLLPSRQ